MRAFREIVATEGYVCTVYIGNSVYCRLDPVFIGMSSLSDRQRFGTRLAELDEKIDQLSSQVTDQAVALRPVSAYFDREAELRHTDTGARTEYDNVSSNSIHITTEL